MKTKIYTKSGDAGETSVIGRDRVSKADVRLSAYGSIDELNACLGICCAQIELLAKSQLDLRHLRDSLRTTQNDLFAIGSQLACADEKMRAQMPQVRASSLGDYEHQMDQMTDELPELREFILPGGHPLAAYLHLARTVCRRAEREVVTFDKTSSVIPYLNRLGDYLFVAARYVNHKTGAAEIKWQK